MAAIGWKSAVSGSWTLGSNWDSGTVPGSGDDVTIGVAGTYTVALTASISVNSITLSDPQATLRIANPGGAETVAGNLANAGTLNVDNILGDGGSSLALGGTLSNSGTVQIGNTSLGSATTATASGLLNSGTINLQGSAGKQATLNILGPAPATLGNFNIRNDALLQFASGAVTGIAAGTTFSLRDDVTPISLNASGVTTGTFSNAGTLNVDNILGDGGSTLALGGTLSNSGTVQIGNNSGNATLSAATTVTATGLLNSGTINLQGSTAKQATLNILGPAPATLGNFNIVGDALLQFASGAVTGIAAGTTFSLRDDVTPISLNASGVTTGTFSNAGTLNVDILGNGGSSLAIGSTLSNSSVVNIGNTGLTEATTATASGLLNSGTINLQGSAGKQATLNILGPAPATLGNFNIRNDALLQFASGAVTGIAAGTTFSLRDDVTPISLNASGVTTGTFSNAGTLNVDNILGDGGSTLALGGTLSNSGTVQIGNNSGNATLSAATTVTATGLLNSGTINLQGSTAKQATLNILGPAPATLGNFNIVGDALLQFASGAVTGIAAGTTFSLRDDVTPISLNASGVTTGTFSNAGTLNVDILGNGGSSLAIGSTLSNSSVVNIGNTGLTEATTATASGLLNSGTINLQGSAGKQATLNILGPAPATLGNFNIRNDALLQFASGAVTGIAAGTTFSLRDDVTPISLNASGVTTGTFSNAGTLNVDNILGDGGSTLALGGTLSNSGTVQIGNASLNASLSAPTTVTATGLVNSGAITLGSKLGGPRATLSITGPGTPGIAAEFNTGTITSNADGIAINGAARLLNGSSGSAAGLISAGYAGVILSGDGALVNFGTITSTQVGVSLEPAGAVPGAGVAVTNSGLVTAATGIVDSGPSGTADTIVNHGRIAGTSGAGITLGGGADRIDNFGTITGANGTAVAFGGGAGTVVIEPGAVFNGVLGGLAKSDIIDFAHVVATGFTFVNATLTLFNHGTMVPGATVAVTGSFAPSDLALVSDGAGGVEVGIAPLGPVIVGTYYTPILLSNPAINNSATVTATGRVAPSYGDAIIGGAGVPGTVANLGTIAAASPSSVGISLGDGGLIANGAVGFAGGYIAGSLAGIKIGGGSAVITNLATIGGGSGVLIAPGSLATVSNAGTIAGTGGTAVSLGGGTNRLILAPGATLQGKADGGGGNSVVEVAAALGGLGAGFGAAGAAAAAVYVSLGSVSNFSALQIDPGATANTGGSILFDTLVNQGQINLAAGDTLVVGSAAGSGGTLDLKSGGSVHVTGAVAAGQTVLFRPPGGSLALDHPEAFSGAISEFAAADVIDLPLGKASFQQYAGGVLSLSYGGGTVALQLSTIYAAPQFQLTDDGHGGTDIFAGSAAPCFCRGTRVLTERGEVAVEDLRVGERAVTLSGAVKPIRWIGMGCQLVTRANKLARPIVVQQGALADGVPHRDLYLTHGHALYLDGALIPVEHLVNHKTIRWDERAQVVEYYHIELDDHDVLLADGAPAESYHDAGNRASFHNARPGSAAGAAVASATVAGATGPTCAPVLHGGAVVEAVWSRLLARAGGPAACEMTADPDLHLVVDGERLEPEMSEGGVHRFVVPRPPNASLQLRSRVGVPSLLGQGRGDHRPLGVAITQIVLRQAGIATHFGYDQPQLREAGAYPHEDGFCWTDGDLLLPPRFFPPLAAPVTLLVHTEPHPDVRYPLTPRVAQAA